MAIKVFINIETGQIEKYEPITYKEVIVDFDINDSLVIDDETGEIVKIQNSIQGKKMIEELQSRKELDDIEQQELKFLMS
ncbi:MAG TPA: hypothetical protein PLW93_01355 [Candidatus Absconditabacterales bacterium]|nr:hypothetical protein [Candidatus Absconditabacterales bacterium]